MHNYLPPSIYRIKLSILIHRFLLLDTYGSTLNIMIVILARITRWFFFFFLRSITFCTSTVPEKVMTEYNVISYILLYVQNPDNSDNDATIYKYICTYVLCISSCNSTRYTLIVYSSSIQSEFTVQSVTERGIFQFILRKRKEYYLIVINS